MSVTIEDHFENQKQVMVDGIRVAYVNTTTGGVVFLPTGNYRRARRKPKFVQDEVIEEVRRQLDGFA